MPKNRFKNKSSNKFRDFVIKRKSQPQKYFSTTKSLKHEVSQTQITDFQFLVIL